MIGNGLPTIHPGELLALTIPAAGATSSLGWHGGYQL